MNDTTKVVVGFGFFCVLLAVVYYATDGKDNKSNTSFAKTKESKEQMIKK